VDMDKRTVDLALAGGATAQEPPRANPAKWDETRPHAERRGEERSFGKNGKRGAAEARERNRRSQGKKRRG